MPFLTWGLQHRNTKQEVTRSNPIYICVKLTNLSNKTISKIKKFIIYRTFEVLKITGTSI